MSGAELRPGLGPLPDHRPRFPADRQALGIAFVGFGGVARKWHLTAYCKYGLRVVGAYDSSPEAAAEARRTHPEVPLYPSLDALLDDPEVALVDLATRPRGRLALIERALRAGKHVLAQKPLTPDLAGLADLVALARRSGLRVAVNQNGRWAPPWRMATLLLEAGAIGEVVAVTHVFDTRLTWIPDLERHASSHFLLFDYASHWIDVSRCWLRSKELCSVQARDPEAPLGLAEGTSQGAWIAMHFGDGSTAVIRGVACGASHGGHPFWIHGTAGTLRGDVDRRPGDWLEIESPAASRRLELDGEWFPDGFAGTMGELMCAVEEGREPSNSLADNQATVRATLAACRSADLEGAAVDPRELAEESER